MMIFSIMEESFRIARTIFFLFSNPVDTILRITIEVGGNKFCLIDTFFGENQLSFIGLKLGLQNNGIQTKVYSKTMITCFYLQVTLSIVYVL